MADRGKRRDYGLTPPENDELFSAIASKYDFLNHLLSLGFDKKWKRELVECAGLQPGQRILDVCTGTGDVIIRFAEQNCAEEIIGMDLSEKMLAVAEKKIKKKRLESKIILLKGDALGLPFEDNSFDVVSIGFGLRNVDDHKKGISEMVRVAKGGGRVMMLEFSPPPEGFFGLVYNLYLSIIVSVVGGIISGSKSAYSYLQQSIVSFVRPEDIVGIMQMANLRNIFVKKLTGGVVYLYRAEKQIELDDGLRSAAGGQEQSSDQKTIQGDLFDNL